MKQLIVYAADSYFKYQQVYERILYEVCGDQILRVHERDGITGEEREIAVFKNWDYLQVEEI